MHFKLINRGLFALLLLLLNAPPILHAQNASDLAPQVIDVFPQGELEITQPLVLTFDQPMDHTSVEQALSISPAVALNIDWLDPRTLKLSPVTAWERATSYSLSIATTAQAQTGTDMPQAYTLHIEVGGELSVTAVTPEAGADTVDANNARIVVTFDRPVIPLQSSEDAADLPSPLTIEPTISGQGRWINTSIYVFEATQPLQGNTQYQVTVSTGLTAVDGSTLVEPFTWTFRTLAPQVLDITATKLWTYKQVLLDSSFSMHFSQPMEQAVVEEAFTLLEQGEVSVEYPADYGTLVAGKFRWNASRTEMIFTPDQHLQPGERYVAKLSAEARSADGAAVIREAVQSAFNTVGLPAVSKASPASGETVHPGQRAVRFQFNTPINGATYEGRYTISPQPQGEVIPYVQQDGSLLLQFQHEIGVITVTLLPGIEDIYGHATTESYTLTYFVSESEVRNSVQMNLNSDFAIAGTYRDETDLRLSVTGDPAVTFKLYRADIDTLKNFDYQWQNLNFYYSHNDLYHQYDYGTGRTTAITPPWVDPDNLLRTWTKTYHGEHKNQGTEVREPLTLADGTALPLGLYGVEVDSPAVIQNGFLLAVANSSITMKSAPGGSLIWVTDLASGEPVATAEITSYWQDKTTILGRTDSSGLLLVPDQAIAQGYLTATQDGVYGVWYKDQTNSSLESTNSYLYTDRPIYRPGETVYFRGIFRDQRDVTYTVPQLSTVYVSALSYQDFNPANGATTPTFETEITPPQHRTDGFLAADQTRRYDDIPRPSH